MKMGSIRFCIILYLATLLIACNSEKSSTKHSHTEETGGDTTAAVSWKEMDEFHVLMAESFHSYMDSTNLAPAKTLAEELSQAAAKWAAAPLPERVDNEGVRAKIDKLKTTSQEFATIVKAGNDEAIGKALTDLHHLFHEIQNEWYSGNGAGEHKHPH